MNIYENLKVDWNIKKKEIKDLGINPDKDWGEITYNELSDLAEHLEVLISDII